MHPISVVRRTTTGVFARPVTRWRSSAAAVGARWSSSRASQPSAPQPAAAATSKSRVIGIMAHIDAGKTTTTERMLYYSGFQRTVGEVHHGNTTMDYLEQERDRGITIQSAAVSFPWRDHCISLVDTPGHVDFTIEVERCIRVVDGAVAVIDASAGVEAQTITVWRQADRYGVPRLCYLNKMDKPAASYTAALQDLRKTLGANPLLLQVPVGQGKQFRGVVDLLTGHKITWDENSLKDQGCSYNTSPAPITASSEPELYAAYSAARAELCEQLGDCDDSVAEHIVEHETADTVPAALLQQAVRRATLQQLGVPVVLGSSYRNTAVQPLMDAILHYLPGPLDRLPHTTALYSPHFCALAFKILYDARRGGILTFIRIYTGTLDKGGRLYNVSRQYTENASKMYTVLAEEYREVRAAGPGSIVVLAGLKKTTTGDTLVASLSVLNAAREKLQRKLRRNDAPATPAKEDYAQEEEDSATVEEDPHLLVGVKVPEPVFFCSIEASSIREQQTLEQALAVMQREDPSLRVRHDEQTGQLVMAGMGELHLEVVSSRLKSQYKVDADLGKLQVAYREEISTAGEYTMLVDKTIGDSRQQVELTLAVERVSGLVFTKLLLKHTKDNQENLSNLQLPRLAAVKRGVLSTLTSGPVLSCPVYGIQVYIKWLTVSRKTSDSFLISVASKCLREVLEQCQCRLTEPVMKVTLTADADYSDNLLADLAHRRADIQSVCHKHGTKHIFALVPLSELIGYSSATRRLSSGRASLSIELHEYRLMRAHEQAEAIKQVTGFYPT